VAAAGGLSAAVGAAAWLTLAAAQRPSPLSPPTLRADDRWLRGPLSGLLPRLSTDPARLHRDLTAALVVMFAGWLVAWIAAPSLPTRAVAAVTGLAQVVMVIGPPQPLTDTFNYIVYGRMAADGLNPYLHTPVQGAHDGAYLLANWHHLPSPYGPLFTLLSEPLALLPLPAAYWTWKVVVLASSLGILACVWALAVRLGRSPQRAIACVGLCPVVLAIGVGGLHNDAPALLCVLVAALLIVRARDDEGADGRWDAVAGALAVVSAGLKPSFAVAVPLVVLGARHRTWAVAGAAWSAAAVVGVMVAAFGGALPAIGLQGRLVTPLSLPNLAGWLTGHGGADAPVRGAARDALAVVVAVACVVVVRRRDRFPAALALVLLAAVLTLAWVMPWYLAWSLPFAAVALRPRALVPLAIVGCLWLGIGGIPQMPKLVHDVGFFPTRSATGLTNHDLELELVR
jgi:hypothetical protein